MSKCISIQRDMPVVFQADRPLLFYIRESQQNLTVFSGKFITNQ